jgi:hypothetical protein
MLVPGITSAFIPTDIFKKEGYHGFTMNCKNLEMDSQTEEVNGFHEGKRAKLTTSVASEVELKVDVTEGNAAIPENSSWSNGGWRGCGSGCGNVRRVVDVAVVVDLWKFMKSGGCGAGGCGSNPANENKACNSCADEYPKETALYVNEAVAA